MPPPEEFCFEAVRPCICASLKVRELDILQTAYGNFTKFTTEVQLGTKMNWLDFEVKRSKVRITARQNIWSNEHPGRYFLTYLRNAYTYM